MKKIIKKRNKKTKENFWDKKLNRIKLILGIIIAFIVIFEGISRVSNLIPKSNNYPIEISGKILDTNLIPIPNANIDIVSSHLITKSRTDGTFFLKIKNKKIDDKVKIIISHSKYKTREFEKEIKNKKEYFGEIILGE